MDKILDLPTFFPYQLSILQEQVSAIVGQHYRSKHGLSRNQWRVMAALAQHGEMCAKKIGKYVKLEKMPISRAIKDLKARSLVRQSKDAEDRRLSRLELTEEGLRCYQDIVPHALKQEEMILAGLSAEERKQFIHLTEKMMAHIVQFSDECEQSQ